MKQVYLNGEENVINSLKKGDKSAFEYLYDQYWKQLFGIALKFLGSPDESKDVVQELFVELWVKKDFLQIQSSLSGYLHQALKNRILNFIRSKSIKDKYVDLLMIERQNINSVETDHYLNFKALDQAFHQEIEALPEKCAQIFRMNKIEDYSIPEIAQKLDLSPQTVKNQLQKASKRIRQNLGHYAIEFLIILNFNHFL